jgi:hypothetical protein
MSPQPRDRLRLVFGKAPDAPPTPEEAPREVPWVDFVAFTEDCRVSGRIQLDADRLSDTLNEHLEYVLCGVQVESLEDGRSARADEVPIDRDELLAVLADGPRGDPKRRTHTLAYPVVVKAGSFLVRGNLHALPGVEPLAAARRRRPMIPLSDATIAYRSAGTDRVSPVGTIVVNRDTADWIQLAAAATTQGPAPAKPKLAPVSAIAETEARA